MSPGGLSFDFKCVICKWTVVIIFIGICVIVHPTYGKSTPTQVMVWYRQATSLFERQYTNTEMSLVSACSCLCAIYWSHILSGEWICSWSNADRRCSNYIWVINNLVAYQVRLILETWWYVTIWCFVFKKKDKRYIAVTPVPVGGSASATL